MRFVENHTSLGPYLRLRFESLKIPCASTSFIYFVRVRLPQYSLRWYRMFTTRYSQIITINVIIRLLFYYPLWE